MEILLYLILLPGTLVLLFLLVERLFFPMLTESFLVIPVEGKKEDLEWHVRSAKFWAGLMAVSPEVVVLDRGMDAQTRQLALQLEKAMDITVISNGTAFP